MLVIAGGMNYAYPESTSIVGCMMGLIAMTVVFTIICLFCSQDTQLKWAKLLTFVFAVIMAVVLVGLILQVCENDNVISLNICCGLITVFLFY